MEAHVFNSKSRSTPSQLQRGTELSWVLFLRNGSEEILYVVMIYLRNNMDHQSNIFIFDLFMDRLLLVSRTIFVVNFEPVLMVFNGVFSIFQIMS